MLRPFVVLVSAVFLGAVSLPAAEPQSAAPLAEIRAAGGGPLKIERAGGVVRFSGPARLEARVMAAADAFLCRLAPGGNAEVVQLSIGRPPSLRASALYSPLRDEALSFEADRVELCFCQGDHYHLVAEGPLAVRVEKDFMKTRRQLPYFRPLDKTVFSRAPAGRCSWYAFWQGIREEDVVRNTDWLAANFRRFGCRYVQIDDGWQGVGQGNGENRDWYVTEPKKFPHGMKWLADYIRRRGLVPGIWLIPFATSDAGTFRGRPELFLRRPDGGSAFETRDPASGRVEINWTGRYAIDPTRPQARAWLTKLFEMLCTDWGYDYVKIDGQGGSAGICQQFHDRLADTRVTADDAYRLGLAAIKAVMGPKRFLLNCGGQFSSCGYCEGIRIGGDVGPDWPSMQPAIQATMQHLYTNNVCFWTDPDVVCVRLPLTLDQARLWATLVGITGQLLMASDDMPKLPEQRVEILRRIFPVADIRPMDLYPLPGKPRIFDLRVSLPGVGLWDVAALFNWDSLRSVSLRLAPEDLGWAPGSYIYYDVWEKQLLGAGADGLTLALPPTSCKLIAARPLAGHPQLVGTSRHITQGADDLVEARWDPSAMTWSGRSRVVGGDPYELRFTLPPGWVCAGGRAKRAGPLAILTLRSPDNQTTAWRIAFHQGGARESPPERLPAKVTAVGRTARVAWDGAAGAIAYRVYRNGVLLGQTGGTSLVDHVRTRGTYAYEVAIVGWEGEVSRTPAGRFELVPLPRGTARDVWLDELAPLSQEQDYGSLERCRSVEGKPLRVGGRKYARGLGTHANSQIRYMVDNRYRRFEAQVGVDDEKDGAGTVVFQVFADGRKVFDSGVMRGRQPACKVSVSLDGVEELVLAATDAGDGINCDHADWADARLIGNPGTVQRRAGGAR
jgi:hypothetical protein